MTTSVKVSAHCSIEKQVRISKTDENNALHPDVVIQDGQTHEAVVYDGWSVKVREELRPVLTASDAAADLAGTPRPAR